MFTPNRCPHNLDEVIMLDLHTPSKLREAVPSQVLRSDDALDAIEAWLTIVQTHLCEHLLPLQQSHPCTMHTSPCLQLHRLCLTACCFSCDLHPLLSVQQIVCYSHAILFYWCCGQDAHYLQVSMLCVRSWTSFLDITQASSYLRLALG